MGFGHGLKGFGIPNNQVWDASAKMEKAKYPLFNTRCLKCKGKITISVPIFGGFLKCWETECPPTVKRLKTITPNHYNNISFLPDDLKNKVDGSKYDENDDEGMDDGDAWTPVIKK